MSTHLDLVSIHVHILFADGKTFSNLNRIILTMHARIGAYRRVLQVDIDGDDRRVGWTLDGINSSGDNIVLCSQ